jgi:hypothetical protein
MSGESDIRAQALEVAAGWSPPGAPESWQLTAALFRVIVGHQELLGALASVPSDRLPAMLASAAICFLVRRDQPQPLASYFPEPGRPQPAFGPGFDAAARDFVSGHLAELTALCQCHRYQMNEVARCTQMALGIAAARRDRAAPVALVDLGTGAGLGLQLDRYRYAIDGASTGPPDAALTLTCERRGRYQVPRPALPPIASRAGIDVDPVDLEDPDAVAWLQACAPPEASALTRLAAAVEVTRRTPAPVVTGDAISALPDVIASLPADLPVLVTDAYLAVFLPSAERARLIGALADAARTRPVTWLSLDPLVPLGPAGRDSVQGVALPDWLVSDYQRTGVFAVLGERTFAAGAEHARLLARAHPSGQWVEWLDPASS